MKTSPLNDAEQQTIKEFKSQIVGLIVIRGVVYSIISIVVFLFIYSQFKNLAIGLIAILFFVVGFFLFSFFKLRPFIQDLKFKIKRMERSTIIEKKIEERWAYHLNATAHIVGNRPKLDIYILNTSEREILVSEEFYAEVKEGDEILVSVAPKTGLILDIEKVNT